MRQRVVEWYAGLSIDSATIGSGGMYGEGLVMGNNTYTDYTDAKRDDSSLRPLLYPVVGHRIPVEGATCPRHRQGLC